MSISVKISSIVLGVLLLGVAAYYYVSSRDKTSLSDQPLSSERAEELSDTGDLNSRISETSGNPVGDLPEANPLGDIPNPFDAYENPFE